MFVSIWGVKNSICGVQKDVCFFWDGIGWNLHECIQRKSRWVTVISDGLDVYDMIYEVSQYLPSENESSHPTLWKDEKLTKLPKMWSSDSFFSNFPHLRRVHAGYRRRAVFLTFLVPTWPPLWSRVFWRLSGVSQVEKPLKTWQPLRCGTVDELEISGYLYIYIYTHIYTYIRANRDVRRPDSTVF